MAREEPDDAQHVPTSETTGWQLDELPGRLHDLHDDPHDLNEIRLGPHHPRLAPDLNTQLDALDAHPDAVDHTHSHSHTHGLDTMFRARLVAIADATLNAIRRHWLAGINTLLVTLIGLAVLTPIGYGLGLTGASDAVFHAYRFICGQTPSHSFYIFGYQMCLCTRCLAIYSALLSGGILLALLRQSLRIHSLSWKYWLVAMIPMALDGGTQLFGLRESNLALRLFTGALFGLATAWFLFPQIEEASRDALATRVLACE